MQQARQIYPGNRLVSPAEPYRNSNLAKQPGSRLRKVKLLFILMSCFILSIVVIAQYSQLVITNYRLGNARAELAAITEISGILEIEAAQLGTIGRIEQIAKVDLGMVEPEIGQIRVLTAHQGEGNRLGE